MVVSEIIVVGLYLLLIAQVAFAPVPKQEKQQTPEEQLGDAIAKYLSKTK